MRSAIQELIDDGKAEGRAEGKAEGIAEGRAEGISQAKTAIITNMIRSGMPDADICAIAECEQSLIDEIKRTCFKSNRKHRWLFW